MSGVSETALITVWLRARESQQTDGILADPVAESVVQGVPYDFTRFANLRGPTQIGVSVRTRLIDAAVADFVRDNPHGAVVNLGAGLCTRYWRLPERPHTWIDVDLAPVHDWRRRLFPVTEHRLELAGSALDTDALDAVRSAIVPGRAVLVVAEGLLMYFEPAQVRALLMALQRRFAGAPLLADVIHPLMADHPRWHPELAVCESRVRFGWGIRRSAALERWLPGLRVEAEWHQLDYFPARWGGWRVCRFIPPLRRLGRVLRIRLPRVPGDVPDELVERRASATRAIPAPSLSVLARRESG